MAQDGGAILSLVSVLADSGENLHKLTRHHRRLKSDGGSNSSRNISRVPLWKHRAWHTLYQDMEPEDVGVMFRQDYEVFGTDMVKSDLMVELHQKWANNTRDKIKRREAWYALFAEMTLDQIVTEINTVWIDPDFHIRIETIRVKVTRMMKGPQQD